jgi:hypothetical protein
MSKEERKIVYRYKAWLERKNMRFSLTKSYNNKHEKLFDKNKTEAATQRHRGGRQIVTPTDTLTGRWTRECVATEFCPFYVLATKKCTQKTHTHNRRKHDAIIN